MEELRLIQKRQGPLAARRRVDLKPRTAVTEWAPVDSVSTFMVKYNASSKQGTCWSGYHRVEGKKQYSEDSCAKNGSNDKRKEKRRPKKSGESGSETDTSASGSD